MEKTLSIIPHPQEIRYLNKNIDLKSCLFKMPDCHHSYANSLILEMNELLNTKPSSYKNKTLRIIREQSKKNETDESYELKINEEQITIKSDSQCSFIWALQSLRQLVMESMVAGFLPCVEIYDKPRYSWRGLLLDCCRHFMPIPLIKNILNIMSFYKMNVFHWHLTEDHGWRIEIDAFPKLREISAFRGQENYGGFYTKNEISEIIVYASQRGIQIIPEIELPGHCQAALAAYPELSCTGGPFEVSEKWGIHEDVYCAGKEKVFTFLETVLKEVIELFPSSFIHIGGDEVLKKRWKKCPDCQTRIKSENLKNENQLQFYFINRINNFLNKNNKRLIGWDEILDGGILENAVVQYWRAFKGIKPLIKALKNNHKVILSPTSHCYLDYDYKKISLKKAYGFSSDIYKLEPEDENNIIGIQGNMWTERAPIDTVQNKIFPRLIALSEAAWTQSKIVTFQNFKDRLIKQKDFLLKFGINIQEGL